MPRFSDVYIKALKPKDKKYTVRDDASRGFAMTVSPAGGRTWQYVYYFGGKKRYLNLGHYPATSLADARKQYDEARKLLEKGVDPTEAREEAEEQQQKMPTISELFTEYMAKHARPNKAVRTWKEDERTFNKEILPAWGKRKADTITRRDVSALLDTILERGAPIAANNTFERIRQLFNFAIEKGHLEHSPCDRMKTPAPKTVRDRFLADAELKMLWESLETAGMTDEIRRALKLILLTGQRPGEVIGLHRREIDGQWWIIPSSRAKNGVAHSVYLTKTALKLVGDKDGYIFESPRDEKPAKEGEKSRPKPMDVNALARAVRNNCPTDCTLDSHTCPNEECKAREQKCCGKNLLGVRFFRPHDLRRTVATHLASLGFKDEDIDALLNHVKRGVVRHYNLHRYDAEKKTALLAWEQKLLKLIGEAYRLVEY